MKTTYLLGFLVLFMPLVSWSDSESDPLKGIDQHPEVIEQLKSEFDLWWEETVPLMVNEDRVFSGIQALSKRYYEQLEEEGIPEWSPLEF